MAVINIIKAIPLTSIDSATFTGAYQLLGSKLPFPCFLIRIINNSNVAVTISYNGTTDNDIIAANTVFQVSFQNNSQPNNFIANIAQGTQVYIKGLAGMGLVYLAGYYQPSIK